MSIAEKLVTIAENMQGVYDKGYADGQLQGGSDSWYDTFWDAYQTNGARTTYIYGFRGGGWQDANFYPKYNINCVNSCNSIFESCAVTNIKERLEECNITLNFSNATSCNSIFSSASTSHLPILNLAKCKTAGIYHTFNKATKLKEIEKLVLADDGSQVFTNAFNNCDSLEHIEIEGTIGENIDIHWSPLNKASIISIINALSSEKSEKTLTLNKTAVNTAFGIDVDDLSTWVAGSEFYDLRHSKDNWTFSYM